MKAVVYENFGKADVLRLADLPIPEKRDTDLLVRVRAAGVNRADILQREGAYGSQYFGDSSLMGLEVAGEVVSVGAAARQFAVGDRVMAIVGGGGYAEFARVDEGMAARVPDGMSFVEAASVMESFVTACEAVSHLAEIKENQSVLVHAAAGGVGSACVEIADALGATVYATASAERMADVQEIGADVVFDYRADDFERCVAERTQGRGVDAVIDFIGGDYLARNLRVLCPGGIVVQVGILSKQYEPVIPLNLVLHNRLRLVGTVMKSRTSEEKRAMIGRFAHLALPLFASGRLRPLIGKVFPMEAAADAQRAMEAGGGFGKIVLEMPHG
ncbi:NAD(P)H-quinone oxidoreductase [Bradyrhizobium sp. STM 3557]|uniref:NAD(P)H-quinone oxidoreductase n=1 Tax=Bradyrhizobium sp. STM 3557 TaxID=578920 RepID=UPI00388FC9C5